MPQPGTQSCRRRGRSGSASRADTPQQRGRPSRHSGCCDEGGLHFERLEHHLPPPHAAPHRACILSSAQNTQESAGWPGRTVQGSLPGQACPAFSSTSACCYTSRWLDHELPEPLCSLGNLGRAVPPWLLGRQSPAACRGAGTSASSRAEPRTEGWFAGGKGCSKAGSYESQFNAQAEISQCQVRRGALR